MYFISIFIDAWKDPSNKKMITAQLFSLTESSWSDKPRLSSHLLHCLKRKVSMPEEWPGSGFVCMIFVHSEVLIFSLCLSEKVRSKFCLVAVYGMYFFVMKHVLLIC